MSKRMFLVLALVAALSMVLFTVVPAFAEVLGNEKIPFTLQIQNSCLGEPVVLSGYLHVKDRITIDGNGGYHYAYSAQPQGVSGEGLLTGTKFQAVGGTREETNVTSGGAYETTYVNNFKIIGQGPNNNWMVHTTFHLTINPDGQITADVSNSSVECR